MLGWRSPLNTHRRLVVAGLGLAALVAAVSPATAQTAPSLGAAQSYAVLGGAAVTNTGPTVVTGDLGVSPGSAVTGFPPGVVTSGTIHAADASAASAQSAVTTAYNNLASQPCTQDLTGQDLGGLTLTPGVYCFSVGAQLTGTVTLNALGNPAAVFVFKIGSTLTTASGSSVVVINGGVQSPCGVFWQVGSSATLGSSTSLVGNILALTSITLTAGASVTGRALARNGAVTLDASAVNAAACIAGGPGCPPIVLSPATLPNGTVGVAYSHTIVGSGGAAPYTFTVTSGTLPAGLTLTTGGVVAGTPTAPGNSTVTIRGTDANGCFTEITVTLVIAAGPVCPPITLLPATLPNGTTAVAYSQTIVGSGGTGPYTFAVTSGTLPAGLTLTTAGVVAGTPTAAGSSTATIRGTDANGCFLDITVTLVIVSGPACPPITLTPATLPSGTTAVPYSQTIVGSGGTGPYTFTVTSGALPAGLTLTTAGLLAGTPTAAASYTFTIRGTDANGCFADIPLTLVVTTAVPTLPQVGLLLLGAGLTALGYARLRRRARAA